MPGNIFNEGMRTVDLQRKLCYGVSSQLARYGVFSLLEVLQYPGVISSPARKRPFYSSRLECLVNGNRSALSSQGPLKSSLRCDGELHEK